MNLLAIALAALGIVASEVPGGAWAILEESIVGYVTLPSDKTYKRDSRQWNSQFDQKTPLAVVYCLTEGDVQLTLEFSTTYESCVSVRSAGHSFPGWAVLDGCVVIDLTKLNSTQVVTMADGQSAVKLQPGTTFWGFTHYMQQHNYTTTHGFGPTVSFGGYTQGGGVGLSHRKLGLAIDNLLAARVVLANATVVIVDQNRHSDLFWAIRGGGGGSFGVVTEYTLRTYPTSMALSVLLEWPYSAKNLVQTGMGWQTYLAQASNDFGFYWRINGSPLLGPKGTKVQIYGIWSGDMDEGRQVVEDLLALIPTAPKTKTVEEVEYHDAIIQLMDPYRSAPRAPFYLRSSLVPSAVDQEVFELLAQEVDQLHAFATFALIWLDPLGGKISELSTKDTAYPYRNAMANFAIFVFYLQPKAENAARTIADGIIDGVAPHMGNNSQVYVNFCYKELENWQSAYYGDNYPRLQSVKHSYDPSNFFTFPQSIEPKPKMEL